MQQIQPNPFRNYSVAEIRDWFYSYQNGKFAPYYAAFEELDGDDLSSLTEEQMRIRCPKKGDVLYNLVRKLTNGPPPTNGSGTSLISFAQPLSAPMPSNFNPDFASLAYTGLSSSNELAPQPIPRPPRMSSPYSGASGIFNSSSTIQPTASPSLDYPLESFLLEEHGHLLDLSFHYGSSPLTSSGTSAGNHPGGLSAFATQPSFSSSGFGAGSFASRLMHSGVNLPSAPLHSSYIHAKSSATSSGSDGSELTSQPPSDPQSPALEVHDSVNPELMVLVPPAWNKRGFSEIAKQMKHIFQQFGEDLQPNFMGKRYQFCIISFSRWTDLEMRDRLVADRSQGKDPGLRVSNPDGEGYIKFKLYVRHPKSGVSSPDTSNKTRRKH